MTSKNDLVLSGFAGTGSNVTNFEAVVGSWSIDTTGKVKAAANFRAQLIHKTPCWSGPFSISAELTLSDIKTQSWDGVVVNFRPNRARNGNEFLTLRVRRGGSSIPWWQLLVVDTATKDDSDGNVIANGPLTGLQASDPVQVTLLADVNRVLQYRIDQNGKTIGQDTISSTRPIEWANDARVGVYSYMGGYTSFGKFEATSNPGVFDRFQRSGTPGTLEAQQLAGTWQEDLDDWIVANGSARSAGLTGAAKDSILLHLQSLLVDPATSGMSSVLSADVKLDDTDSWTGLVFGGRNNLRTASHPHDNTHPDNYFAFQIKNGQWRVIHRVQTLAEPEILRSGTGPALASGETYRLSVQFQSTTSMRVSVIQNGALVLDQQLSGLPAPNGARFGLYSSSTRNAFTQVAASDTTVRPGTPPVIVQSGTPSTWTAAWTPNATYWSSPYKVSTPVLLDEARIDGASNNCKGDPQQCLFTLTDESGNPVRQYVGYYNVGNGAVGVTKRSWSKSDNNWAPFETPVILATRLPSVDGHYRIAIRESADGHVHLVANIWASPLVYYKTTTPGNLSTLTLQDLMVSKDVETSTTYPEFMRIQIDGKDRLLFIYRTGGSGNGDWIINQYVDGKWSRYLSGFLFARTSKSGTDYSAYPATRAPVLGPDGNYHLAWIWRSTELPDTNSRICYAYSANLRTWRSASGEIIANGEYDPITYDDVAAIVDDVPERGGALNGLVSLGFDHDGQPVIGYVKFDDPLPGTGTPDNAYLNGPGSSQFYTARWRNTCGSWQRTQLTNYLGRWAPPSSAATLPTPFNIGGTAAQKTSSGDKVLVLPYIYGEQAGTFVLSSETLEVIGETDWRTYSKLKAIPTGMRTAVITKDSSTAMFGANRDEEYVLLNFAVGETESLPVNADTSMKVLRVK
ncbi:BNR repeat-containing protein [Caballeronia sp. J97]|uniref:BNR repeat-containing protein n=1 Tax=Caballeronia sp. J97 TaxID=2805429 RepID=UPI002AB0F556|nr:BNR repeat-containing protein [Caballeronia sp. J97]